MKQGPSVKHVLSVLEWSYVVPEKTFSFKNRVWLGVTPPPCLVNHQTFYLIFSLKPSLSEFVERLNEEEREKGRRKKT